MTPAEALARLESLTYEELRAMTEPEFQELQDALGPAAAAALEEILLELAEPEE